MSQSLAVTVFSSGALDELRTIDAYGLESAKGNQFNYFRK